MNVETRIQRFKLTRSISATHSATARVLIFSVSKLSWHLIQL